MRLLRDTLSSLSFKPDLAGINSAYRFRHNNTTIYVTGGSP